MSNKKRTGDIDPYQNVVNLSERRGFDVLIYTDWLRANKHTNFLSQSTNDVSLALFINERYLPSLKRKCVTFVDLLCFGSHDVSHSYSYE